MTLTIKLDGNWSSFQLANSAPPLSVTDSAIAPSARINMVGAARTTATFAKQTQLFFFSPFESVMRRSLQQAPNEKHRCSLIGFLTLRCDCFPSDVWTHYKGVRLAKTCNRKCCALRLWLLRFLRGNTQQALLLLAITVTASAATLYD